jgi:hypothetical protein
MPPVNADVNFPSSFLDSIKNEPFEISDMTITLKRKIGSSLKSAITDQINSLWVCLQNPRNEIDNPINYCTQPFYTQISTFVVSNATINTSMDYQFASEYQPMGSALWSVTILLEEKFKDRIQRYHNSPKDSWKWFPHGKIPMAEYYALAYIIGSISAEKAIELSGLNYVDFAQMVEEKAIERDLPIFHAYLRDEDVKARLLFSKEKSLKFKDLMAKEIE